MDYILRLNLVLYKKQKHMFNRPVKNLLSEVKNQSLCYKMGNKGKNKKKGKGAEKTTMKTDKKLAIKQKKLLKTLGETDIEQIIAELENEELRLQKVSEQITQQPSPRSNFSLCSHPEKEELILFGGEFYNGKNVFTYNDLYFYNIPKNEWKLIKSPSGPTARSGHQMVSVANNGGLLWLFGGEHSSPSQLQFYHYKDLWVFSLVTKKWEKINAMNGPSPRSGHRMIANNRKLIIFGGFHDNNQTYKYFNDVHIFSIESYSWLEIEIGNTILPTPRSGCCMAAMPDGKILIWGGYSKSQIKKDIDKGITHTDMFALVNDKINPNKFKWTTIKPGGWRTENYSGVGFGQANNKVYCFGGVKDTVEDEEDLQGTFGNDLYMLDLINLSWRLVEIKQYDKTKKQDENIDETMEESNSTVTSDGVYTCTVSSSLPPTTGKTKLKNISRPSPRMNAGITVCKGHLYVYGGIYEEANKQYTLNDFYGLDIRKLDTWRTIVANQFSHEWMESSDDESGSESESESSENDNGDSSDNDGSSEMDID